MVLKYKFLRYSSIFLIGFSMRSATAKFVTIFDVCVVVGACLCGAISGLFGYKIVQSVNIRLSEVRLLHFWPAETIYVETFKKKSNNLPRQIKSYTYTATQSAIRDRIC